MAPRAQWQGTLKLGELSCAVHLYTAASTAERISFNMLNRETGNRVKREFVDSETGEEVERDDQIKGYEFDDDEYVTFEPEDIEAVVPHADKVLEIEDCILLDDVDDIFFDKPYYLTPVDEEGEDAFAVIREGLRKKRAVGIASTVLFRRFRTLLIHSHGKGLIATMLNYDYEVKPAGQAFKEVPKVRMTTEMLDLAKHIIDTKKGTFDPEKFEDRYEAALSELIQAKIEGRQIEPRKRKETTETTNLLDALRQSAGSSSDGKAPKRNAASKAKPRRASHAKAQKSSVHASHKKAS